MTKRILALFLSVCLCLGLATTAFATESMDSTSFSFSDEEFMTLTILQNSGIQITPTSSFAILDISGNPTIVCVEFVHSGTTEGFGLIDLTTYTVTMYALDAITPFDSNDIVVSDGVLNFAVVDESLDTAIDVNTQAVVSLNVLLDDSRIGLSIMPQEERAAIVDGMKNSNGVMQARNTEPVLVAGGSDETLVYSAGNNSGSWSTDCGINAVAMYLRHMGKYFDSSYVSSAHTTESSLKGALASLANTEWSTTTSLSMDRLATLTNLYTNKYGGSTTTKVSNSSYSWTTYKSRINNGNGKPCILYIGAGKTSYWDSAHAVVGVGYTSGATSTSGYVVANSGWVSLKYVNIATSIPGYIIK
jgi:hypothetical protein